MSGQEFVFSLWYWLGIPLFTSTDPIRCSCGSVVDRFGDHLLGCGHGPMRIRRHDALCDIVFHALLQDNSGCKREQPVVAPVWIALVMFFIQTFCMVSLLDVTVRNPLHAGFDFESVRRVSWYCCITG